LIYIVRDSNQGPRHSGRAGVGGNKRLEGNGNL